MTVKQWQDYEKRLEGEYLVDYAKRIGKKKFRKQQQRFSFWWLDNHLFIR